MIRDGQTIETLVKGVDEMSEDRIIKGMVGREMEDRYPKRVKNIGEVIFEVKDWKVYDPLDEERLRIKNISFNAKKGEIVSIVGPTGSGKSRLLADIEWAANEDTPTKRKILILINQVADIL